MWNWCSIIERFLTEPTKISQLSKITSTSEAYARQTRPPNPDDEAAAPDREDDSFSVRPSDRY